MTHFHLRQGKTTPAAEKVVVVREAEEEVKDPVAVAVVVAIQVAVGRVPEAAVIPVVVAAAAAKVPAEAVVATPAAPAAVVVEGVEALVEAADLVVVAAVVATPGDLAGVAVKVVAAAVKVAEEARDRVEVKGAAAVDKGAAMAGAQGAEAIGSFKGSGGADLPAGPFSPWVIEYIGRDSITTWRRL